MTSSSRSALPHAHDDPRYEVRKEDDTWRSELNPLQYQVTRHAATERPFTGKYENHWADGSYHCICCGAKLFEAQTKFDAGCGWLHSAKRNPWTRIAEAAGVTIDRSSPNWGVQWRDLGFPPDEQRAFGEAYDRFETAAHAALDGPDRPLSDFVAADEPWRPMIDAISGYANGAPLDRVSLHDWAAYEDAASEDNWALPAGYGTLIVSHARGVPVRLDTPVTRIDHRGTRIRLDTPAGTIEAARVILALPTTAYDGLVFDPPLPDKLQAAANLPLGLADKLFLAVDRAEDLPVESRLYGRRDRAAMGSYHLRPFGRPLIECYFGGAFARELEKGGAAAFADYAIDDIAGVLLFAGKEARILQHRDIAGLPRRHRPHPPRPRPRRFRHRHRPPAHDGCGSGKLFPAQGPAPGRGPGPSRRADPTFLRPAHQSQPAGDA